MAIASDIVKELREKTGAGMMDCKKALEAAGGDMEKALVNLREKGLASASRKAARTTSAGVIDSYIHLHGRIGVLLDLACESDFVAKTEEFRALAHDLAMQIAATAPQYISREQVPADVLDKEKEILRVQVASEKKPVNIIDKIVEGRLEKFYADVCLLDQPFVRRQETAIKGLLTEHIAKFGENIVIKRFTRYQLGE